ncbi:MAG: hypothetical protein ACRDUY_12610, partial [Nitriliruptorales bacterium]
EAPRARARAAHRGNRTAHGAVPSLAVADAETGSYFAVVPPDGADARLTVAIDGVLHPVVVQQIRKDVLDSLVDIQELVLTRLTLSGS